MLSLNPNTQSQDFYIDSMKMGLPCLNSLPPSSNFNTTTATTTTTTVKANAVWSLEDPNKKVRKPYTITKARESWTEQEHDKFLEALQLFDRDWKKIEAFVGSKTVIQIRSHAQKYFMKVQKSGTSEHVPPPRPKRKAAHPYPQKAPKNAPVVSQVTGSFQSSAALVEPLYVPSPDSVALPGNTISNPTFSYWTWNAVPPVDVSHVTKDEVGVTRSTVTPNCCSSSSKESTPRMWPTSVTSDEGKGLLGKPVRVTPDFSKVYSFIGSVFDPNASGHLQKLRNMEPINVETVLMLMKNLAVNLTSPEFEDHRKMLSSYNADGEKAKSSSLCNNLHLCKPENAIPSV